MNKNADIKNIYTLDGRVPLAKAVPFGLQHIQSHLQDRAAGQS